MVVWEVRVMKAAECLCEIEGQVAEESAALVQDVITRLRPHFRRQEAHQHVADYLRGLIAEVERKNGWQLAEQAGYSHPRGIQRVLERYTWDHRSVREDLGHYVVAEFGDPAGILVVDETAFVKQGKHSVGVARQYCGTLGKIANCQVGVFLGYASPKGHAGMNGALFVPQEWFGDSARCQKAGIPQGTVHRTKPELALGMLEEALDGGVPARWVVADETYGSDSKLRRGLEGRAQAYVLAVRSNEKPSTWPPYGGPAQVRVADLAAVVPAGDWQRRSCGEGAQGPRLYDWAYVPLRPALREGWVHALLLRRHLLRSEELAYYLVYAPEGRPLEEVVQAAGARWTIEQLFKLAKGQVGLDQYEVRSWLGWHRHITLALVALAVGASKRGRCPARSTSPSPYLKSAGFSCASSGSQPEHRRRCSLGPAGAVGTRELPRSVIGVAA
jgi:SRSO17 transposase